MSEKYGKCRRCQGTGEITITEGSDQFTLDCPSCDAGFNGDTKEYRQKERLRDSEREESWVYEAYKKY